MSAQSFGQALLKLEVRSQKDEGGEGREARGGGRQKSEVRSQKDEGPSHYKAHHI